MVGGGIVSGLEMQDAELTRNMVTPNELPIVQVMFADDLVAQGQQRSGMHALFDLLPNFWEA